jgi:hypothetical protein
MQEEKSKIGIYDSPDQDAVEIEMPNTTKEETIPFNQLPMLERIKIAASQNDVGILEPKSNCKNCYGRGYISTTTIEITSGAGENMALPNPCTCIFNKQDIPKMFPGNVFRNGKQNRKYEKRLMRLHISQRDDMQDLKTLNLEKLKKKRKTKKKQLAKTKRSQRK